MKQGKKHKKSQSGRRIQTRPGPVHQGLVHPHAAGIDVGATEIYVAAPPVGDEQEVRSYYREDALIWSLYLSMRKVDRFIRRRILRQEYPYILPEKIKR